MSDALDFRLVEPEHQYFKGDRRILGTTEILRACGVIDDKWYNAQAAARGRAVHAACHFLAEGDLDWDTLAVEFHGYVEAYQAATEAIDFFPRECERALCHPLYLYGTKPDQIGFIGDAPGKLKGVAAQDDAVVELKTGTMMEWTRLQTAFQAMAKWPDNYFTKLRFGVELGADGKYRVEHFADVGDFDDALGMYLTATWKMKHLTGGK